MDDLYNIIIIIVTIAGIIGTLAYSRIFRRGSRKSLEIEIERVQKEKQKEERETADALANSAKIIAKEVKQDMKDHVDRIIVLLQSDIELDRVKIYAKMDGMDARVAQLKIDLMQHIIDEKDDRIRMQRSLDFMQTMNYGPEAKSFPGYLTGEVETEAHKEEPDKGVFASRKDTTDEKEDSS